MRMMKLARAVHPAILFYVALELWTTAAMDNTSYAIP